MNQILQLIFYYHFINNCELNHKKNIGKNDGNQGTDTEEQTDSIHWNENKINKINVQIYMLLSGNLLPKLKFHALLADGKLTWLTALLDDVIKIVWGWWREYGI